MKKRKHVREEPLNTPARPPCAIHLDNEVDIFIRFGGEKKYPNNL